LYELFSGNKFLTKLKFQSYSLNIGIYKQQYLIVIVGSTPVLHKGLQTETSAVLPLTVPTSAIAVVD
jgi:hypothetical protein